MLLAAAGCAKGSVSPVNSDGGEPPADGGSGSTTTSVLTYHNDNARTGRNTTETLLNGQVYVGTQTELDVYGLLP